METKNNDCLETKIIENAKNLFIEKGFAETSMSDIAAATGINRPALHYYFRTKDRMFQAVFGSIVATLLPKLQDIISNRQLSIEDRVSNVVDIYYDVFKAHPTLPLFIIREMHRDIEYLEKTVMEMHFDQYFYAIRDSLLEQMKQNEIREVPFRFLFLTFYSLLTMPFNVKPVCERILMDGDETYEELLSAWKKNIVARMKDMLSVGKKS